MICPACQQQRCNVCRGSLHCFCQHGTTGAPYQTQDERHQLALGTAANRTRGNLNGKAAA